MNRLLHIARFQSIKDNTPEILTPRSWPEWVRVLSDHQEWPKREGALWSPTEYPPNARRCRNNVISLGAFCLDMDDGHAIEPYLERWERLEFFIHTTYRHTAEAPRWRAVFPLLVPAPGGEAWYPIWERLAWGLAEARADALCKNADRIYFFPSHPPGSIHHFTLRHEGEWLDYRQYTALPPPPPPPARPAGDIPRSTKGRVDGQHLVDRALDIIHLGDRDGNKGRHAGCRWLLSQAKHNRFEEWEARHLGEVFIHQAPGVNTAGEPEPFTQEEMEGLLRWVWAQPILDRWTPKTWEEPRPLPDPPPAPRREVPAEVLHEDCVFCDTTEGEPSPPPPADPFGEEPPQGPPPARPTAEGSDEPKRRILITAPDLMALNLPPRQFAVPGILPEGLGIFAGKTKTGKSWAALGMGVAVATGGRVFGKHSVEQGDVLYLALEDNEESLQERLGLLLQGEPAPARLTFALEWRRTNEGGIDNIEKWLQRNSGARLVMVDVLTKIRPRSKNGSNSQQYEEDYEVCDPLKRLADRYHVAILLLHHLRKLTSEDPLDQILGSVGMSGAPDTAWVFRRARKDPKASLLITGRRIREEQERALQWDSSAVSWLDLGDADELASTREQEEVLSFLRESGSGPKRLKQIADALGKSPDSVRKLCQKLKDIGAVTSEAWGTYAVRDSLF